MQSHAEFKEMLSKLLDGSAPGQVILGKIKVDTKGNLDSESALHDVSARLLATVVTGIVLKEKVKFWAEMPVELVDLNSEVDLLTMIEGLGGALGVAKMLIEARNDILALGKLVDTLAEVGCDQSLAFGRIIEKYQAEKPASIAVKIRRCYDPKMWYASKVGQTVEVVRIDRDGVWAREDSGFLNRIGFLDIA